jgi:ADP-ribose pyrophosphatase
MRYEIDLISRESLHAGFLKVARYRLRHSLFAGGLSRIIVRERLECLRAAAAILYDPHRDQVVMVEQFRIGALEEGRRAWTLEPVGGIIANGEDPAAVVRREALEEAGCEIGALDTIGTYHVSPGTAADKVSLFCGCVSAARANGIHGLHEEDEETRVVVIPFSRAVSELFNGRVDSSSAIVGIQWLAMNRKRLRRVWVRKPKSLPAQGKREASQRAEVDPKSCG